MLHRLYKKQFLSHQETGRRLFNPLAKLGAGPRIALGTSGHEPEMILFHYPAIKDNLSPFPQRLTERVKQSNDITRLVIGGHIITPNGIEVCFKNILTSFLKDQFQITNYDWIFTDK